MNSNLEHKNWQQKLSRWLSGDANRRDELHLEEMARDDAFLADAIEGYRTLPAENHTRKVTQIKARLRQQNQRKRGVAWMKIAAIGAFLVLALLGLREYNQSFNKENTISQKEAITADSFDKKDVKIEKTVPTIAPEETPETEEIVEEVAELPLQKPIQPTPELEAKSKSRKTETTEFFDQSTPNAGNLSTADAAPPTPNASESRLTNNSTAVSPNDAVANSSIDYPNDPSAPEVFVEKPAPSPLNEEEFDKAYEPVILFSDESAPSDEITEDMESVADSDSNSYIGRIVKGKVLSEGGEPLIGANVIVTGTPAGTTTDFEGDFTLNVPDNASIDIRYLGYNDLRVNLQHQNDVEINMEASDLALEEVAVTAKKSSARKAKKRNMEAAPAKDIKPAEVKVAAPKMGVLKFEKYLEQNRRYPEAAKKNNISDTVIVQFKVKKNGQLTDFKILKSVGYGCDEEAIRLLKEGPKWETDIDTVLSYEIEFKNW